MSATSTPKSFVPVTIIPLRILCVAALLPTLAMSAVNYLRDPLLSRGLAASEAERAEKGLGGFMPAAVRSFTEQEDCAIAQLRKKATPLDKVNIKCTISPLYRFTKAVHHPSLIIVSPLSFWYLSSVRVHSAHPEHRRTPLLRSTCSLH